MTKFLVVLGVLALLVGTVYFAFFYNPSKPNVTLDIQVPDQVLVGEPFEATLNYANRSSVQLDNAKISLALPQNVSVLGESENIKVSEIPLGALDPGKTGSEKVELIVLDDPQTVKRLNAKILYSLKSTQSGSYETDTKADVVVGEPAVTLQFSAPETIFSGQNFEIDLHYKNNSDKDFQNAEIRVDYPPIFSVSQSTPPATQGKNDWSLGTLSAGKEGDIKIRGSAVGQDGTALNYNVRFFSSINGQSYELQHQVAGINIAKSPLSLSVTVNGGTNYVAKVGDTLEYVINYQNNSQAALKDATIKAVLVGQLYNLSTLRTSGALNSITKTISWSGANQPDLKNVAPGASGQVSFEVGVLTPSIQRLSDKNFSLKVNAQMESPTVPSGIQASETISAATLETKVQGQFELTASAFLVSGPYPPRANQATTYSVHWKLTNYANDLANVKISAVLESGTTFIKTVSGNPAAQYDSRTGEITWNISLLPAGTGVLNAPLEAVFQVQNTPASNQVGQNVTFLSETNLIALDSFTNVSLSASAPALDTSLPYDTSIQVDDRRVKQ
jgi:hypothetical protein